MIPEIILMIWAVTTLLFVGHIVYDYNKSKGEK
jgi:hypothetical protein